MFIDEVRARRDTKENKNGIESQDIQHQTLSCNYLPKEPKHTSYVEWFNHNEDAYFRYFNLINFFNHVITLATNHKLPIIQGTVSKRKSQKDS